MSNLEGYLRDLGWLLKQEALGVKSEYSNASADDVAYCEGKLFAYYEVLSLMLSQAAAFQIESAALGLDGFSPDRELI